MLYTIKCYILADGGPSCGSWTESLCLCQPPRLVHVSSEEEWVLSWDKHSTFGLSYGSSI